LEESIRRRDRSYRENVLSAISVGAFLILLGVIFVSTPGLIDRVISLSEPDVFGIVRVPGTDVSLPAPLILSAHRAVYSAARMFSLSWGFFLIAFTVARFVLKSSLAKKAETASDVVFWFGAAYLIQVQLLDKVPTYRDWFAFWAALVMVIGTSLIVRGLLLMIFGVRRRT